MLSLPPSMHFLASATTGTTTITVTITATTITATITATTTATITATTTATILTSITATTSINATTTATILTSITTSTDTTSVTHVSRAAPVKKEFGQQADMTNPTPFPSSVPSTPPADGGEAPVAAEIIQALESVAEEAEA